MKAIEMKELSFAYEGEEQNILNKISFSVDYGEIALLAGYSGEGKSTVLGIVSGIIPNLISGTITGEIFVDGENIHGKKLCEICKKVGVILQNADAQIIQDSVEDEIAFGCENFAFPREKIKERIDSVCALLKLAAHWQTRTLSGGQKQRLITASTLAMEQKILILDEPLANLDLMGTEILMKSLKMLSQQGFAILLVEHRLDRVLPYVDRVWNLSKGKINLVSNKEEYLKSQCQLIGSRNSSKEKRGSLFEIDRVNYTVQKREILKEVSFTIQKGERLLLLGENGAGKTTLLRLLARLNRPTKGAVIQHLDPHLKQRASGSKKWFEAVGVVFQNPNYMLFMPTVEEEISFNAVSKEKANEVMQLFHLEKWAKRHPHSLSEGQKRRVSIAAVVAAQPQVLFLDEPTVGQDYTGLKEMVDILNAINQKEGTTLITITHDRRCAKALCDHAVIIKEGVVAQEGGSELAESYFGLPISKSFG